MPAVTVRRLPEDDSSAALKLRAAQNGRSTRPRFAISLRSLSCRSRGLGSARNLPPWDGAMAGSKIDYKRDPQANRTGGI